LIHSEGIKEDLWGSFQINEKSNKTLKKVTISEPSLCVKVGPDQSLMEEGKENHCHILAMVGVEA
jgi:hypothetical protein